MNRFLRDHYTGEVGRIDPPLLDLLHGVQRLLGHAGAFEVISGYRCPATNQRLRREGGGGVATRSLHMDGKAIGAAGRAARRRARAARRRRGLLPGLAVRARGHRPRAALVARAAKRRGYGGTPAKYARWRLRAEPPK
jgi:hypothetical protein